jgi:hypothetical protein
MKRVDTVTGETKLPFRWVILATAVLWGLTGFVFYTIGSLLRTVLT